MDENISHEEVKENPKKKRNFTGEIRKNPWILSTVILGIVALILLVGNFGTTGNGKSVSESDAGKIVLDFAKTQVEGVDLVGVEEESGLYKVTLDVDGRDVPVYLTLDGENLVSGLTPLSLLDEQSQQNTQSEEIPKTDKPTVELFVMSYCPYGTQAEKGILPVVSLLGDKIDFKVRMVHYTLHGEKEDLENNRQLCIREEQGEDKLNKYLVCILDSDDPNAPADVTNCEKEAGIDSAKLQTCLDTNAADYFAADSALSQGYGVQGSPTLIINGVQSSAGRSPASYLAGICDAFINPPEACNEALSTSSPSAGFGYNEGTDTVAQC